MELPGSNIPWLRAVGAVGAVAALVVGGAVTTAGAIDDPGGVEPAEVQIMATDAEGEWFSCDLDVDVEQGPPGAPATLAIARTGVGGAVEADGAAYDVVVSAGGAPDEAGAPVPAPGGAGGFAIAATISSGAPGAPAEAPDGARLSSIGDELPALPTPSEVRPGTPDECASMDVTVGTGPVAVGARAGFGAGSGGQGEQGGQEG